MASFITQRVKGQPSETSQCKKQHVTGFQCCGSDHDHISSNVTFLVDYSSRAQTAIARGELYDVIVLMRVGVSVSHPNNLLWDL